MSNPDGALPVERSLNLYDEFLARTEPDRLQKILARYEVFKMTLDVPGDIVECGVFKGSGIYTWAKLQRLFRPHSEHRIVGFDYFDTERRDELRHLEDRRIVQAHATSWSGREQILRNLAAMGIRNVELIPGDVTTSIRAYAQEHLGFRISLLSLDVDTYEATLACLQNLFPLVSPGGIVLFDQYACRGYGESDAVDEYFRDRPVRLNGFPWAHTPTAWLRKEGS